MKQLKILLCGLLLALPVFAEESDNRQTATSLHYVSHELDTRQDKLSAGTNAALTYTNAAGNVTQRTVKSDLNGGSTTDTSLPQVNAVNAGLNQKQNDIAPIDDHTAVTYTSTTGIIGQKGIYQTDGTYAEQSDNLIDAKTFNAALKNGLDNEFVCADRPDARDPNTNLCWLWQIHTGIGSYVSATGTVTQNGTPTPTNPIYPTFYQQGNMILRKVGDYADSYDATTHKITRRVGVKELDGTGNWNCTDDARCNSLDVITNRAVAEPGLSSHFIDTNIGSNLNLVGYMFLGQSSQRINFSVPSTVSDVDGFKQWLADQYEAGTPVTVYYVLSTPVEEDWAYNENVYIPQNQ